MKIITILGVFGLAAPFPLAAFDHDGVDGVTAVSSKVSADYVRTQLPDGSFRPETYAFGKGGYWSGEIKDKTIDGLTFLDVAHVVARPLASQNFLPAKDPAKTNLLIMLYWGTTQVPEPYSDSMAYDQFQRVDATGAPQASGGGFHGLSSGNSHSDGGNEPAWSAAAIMLMMVNRQRDLIDFNNARMIGYDAAGMIGTAEGNYYRGTALGIDRQDVVDEIEENRYFVVLMAYDFGLLRKEKKHKLLWETRFSINERRNAFDKALPVMAQNAAVYFGRATHGLMRKRIYDGKVDIEPPSLIEFLPSPNN